MLLQATGRHQNLKQKRTQSTRGRIPVMYMYSMHSLQESRIAFLHRTCIKPRLSHRTWTLIAAWWGRLNAAVVLLNTCMRA